MVFIPVQHDYRKYKRPRLWSHEILQKLIEINRPVFQSYDIAILFDIPWAEACTRINILKRYNCIKEVKPKTRPALYEITNWGYKYAEFKKTGKKGKVL